MAIEAVAFDYGGVLTMAPYRGLGAVEEALGLPATTLSRPLQHGTPLAEAELGRRGVAECFLEWMTEVQDATGVVIDPAVLFGALGGATEPNGDTLDLVDRLAGRYRLAILTNNFREIAEHWRDQVPIERFELVIDSHLVGLRKPDRAIYDLLLEQLDLEPEQVVFVDDTEPNVEGAAAAGIHAILFTTAADLERELRAVGVEPAPRLRAG